MGRREPAKFLFDTENRDVLYKNVLERPEVDGQIEQSQSSRVFRRYSS